MDKIVGSTKYIFSRKTEFKYVCSSSFFKANLNEIKICKVKDRKT